MSRILVAFADAVGYIVAAVFWALLIVVDKKEERKKEAHKDE